MVHYRESIGGTSAFFFFLIDKEQYIDQKREYNRMYTKETTKGQQKRGRGKEEPNKPFQKENHTLGIAIEPIQEQSNKVDIGLWNKSGTRKQQSDN